MDLGDSEDEEDEQDDFNPLFDSGQVIPDDLAELLRALIPDENGVCEDDFDCDTHADTEDNCPMIYNPLQIDENEDEIGDACQTIGGGAPVFFMSGTFPPDVESWINRFKDNELLIIVSICDPDPDVPQDPRCHAPDADLDSDGVVNSEDNCKAVSNSDQKDSDGNGIGDVCDDEPDDEEDQDEDEEDAEDTDGPDAIPVGIDLPSGYQNPVVRLDDESERVILNLYRLKDDKPVYTAAHSVSEKKPLTEGTYLCRLGQGCSGWKGKILPPAQIPTGIELYYVISAKIDGETYRAASESFKVKKEETPIELSPSGQVFADVPAGHPNFAAIQYVSDLGVMRGSTATGQALYRPGDFVLRAEAAAIVNRLAGLHTNCAPYDPSRDGNLGAIDLNNAVTDPNSHWYMQEIKCSRLGGILQGYSDGTMRPLQQVTRAESAKLIVFALAASVDGPALNAVLPPIDFSTNPWWAGLYSFLARNGLQMPINEGGSLMTRADVAQFTYDMGRLGLFNETLVRSYTSR